ncbi:transglycosylase SLT domain-containing protein [Neorhizobium sp. NCHU2750]|uniref:transglycosylase SLT domain-containing protein n=1 Tax=Neorhizobium sp. NCHU2750 TaxID=1825976 RepID=UPI000E756B04|nr:membrane protein [Neorhizobium sp. NCHU2750]
MRIAFFIALLSLAGCATAPSRITNACAIFDQRDGFFNNWKRDARAASAEYGIPVPILMATIYVESGFRPNARPPRKWFLGFIPLKRPSSAFGYAQALDGTWDTYKRTTGRWGARRNDFGDAIKFVAWYHYQTSVRNNVPRNDAYNLYLAYYSGHQGYDRGNFSGSLRQTAKKSAGMAARYASQLQQCGY